MKNLACAAALFLLTGAAMAQQSPANASAKPVVVNIMNAESQAVGTATLTPAASGVKIVLDIKKLPPGEHSIHIHQAAKCEPPDFKTAGPHFSPAGHSHDSTPAGDIPDFSLIVGKDGTAHVSTVAPNVTMGADDHSVFSNGGTAIVIHAVAGASGSGAPPRIACGIITKS
jgi:superoxide dismutase, Cu-Zn family